MSLARIPLAAVIGSPVAHSRSPRLFTHWLQTHGLRGHYVPIDVPEDKLAETLHLLPQLGFVGLNVTVPYKEKVMQIADSVSDRARLIGLAHEFQRVNRLDVDSWDMPLHGIVTDCGYYAC